jgi:2-hydroxychromene-2-carboxylate isomerase
MKETVELFYDFRSPYGYLAFEQLGSMEVDLRLRPFKVLALMERVGNAPTTVTCKAKGRYARTDLGRWARRLGVTFSPTGMGTVDGDACARAVLSTDDDDRRRAITSALYRAIWGQGRSLTTAQDIAATLEDADIDVGGLASLIDDPAVADRLESVTEEAVARGVFGSPTMFVRDAMFFGNDRLDFLREEVARWEQAA